MQHLKNLFSEKGTKKSSPMEVEPLVIGDWNRISILGSGGFGTVYLWRSNTSNESIAVKMCKIRCLSNLTDKHRKRWCNEVQIMKELIHPNIVKYKPLDPFLEKELNKMNPSKLPLLSMEYCQKGNLRHLLKHSLNMCGLEEDTVRDVLLNISSALHYLHSKKITHRDIKPENIVIQNCPNKPDRVIYKLIDLGYAKELNDSTVSFVGTWYYLAPEIYANSSYDCSVDYWSLGVLAFEIICGTLPFLPRMSERDRYQWMKSKSPDQICMFINRMDNIEYSSQLFNEIRICSYLKGQMENWLRRALQFDPSLRASPFSNGNNLFEELDCILKKKILTVFVVYTYEFYSYEFDECTRLSTVRQWLARDTQVPEEEQLLLGSFQFSDCDEETLVANCLIDEKYEMFMFKRNALFSGSKYDPPRMVKFMLNKAGQQFYFYRIKEIYAHSVFLIQQDILLATAFARAMDLYLKQFAMIVHKLEKKWETSRVQVLGLNEKLKKFNKRVKEENLSCVDLKLCQKFSKLMTSIQNCLCDEYFLAVNIHKWSTKLKAMETINFQEVVKLPELKEYLNKADLSVKTMVSSFEKNQKMGFGEMLRIICKVTKFRDRLINDKNLLDYTSYLGKASDYLKTISTWIQAFDDHVAVLHEICDSVVAEAATGYRNVERGADCNNKWYMDDESLTEFYKKNSEHIFSKFSKLIDESVVSCNNYREEIDSCIQEISSLL